MPTVTYKCPHCDGGLVFDPQSQKFHCEYCLSYFTEAELNSNDTAKTQQEQPPCPAENDPGEQESGQQGAVYSCPSCGAEILTDGTTAATTCYYCHNPVILSGKLDGDFKPDRIIPFSIQAEQAKEIFDKWMKKKWFIPVAFRTGKVLDNISGVYFPFWVVDAEASGNLNASATKVTTWSKPAHNGTYRYTKTDHYSIQRSGTAQFKDLIKKALKKANQKLVEGVQPFELSGAKDFTMALFSGFQAEIRDISKNDLTTVVNEEFCDATETLLRNSITGYATVSVSHKDATVSNSSWHYVFLPVWTITFRSSKDEIFYCAVNGQTGKICGKLPVSYKRLAVLFGTIAVLLFAILLLGGLFL